MEQQEVHVIIKTPSCLEVSLFQECVVCYSLVDMNHGNKNVNTKKLFSFRLLLVVL